MLFTAFAYPATGAPTSRTTPDRLNDYVSVRDYGADPTGGNTAATFAAFNSAIAATLSITNGYGAVFVPRGFYNIGAGNYIQLPPNLSGNKNSFRIFGESAGSTLIQGNVNGFIFDTGGDNVVTGSHVIEGLTVNNGNTTPFTSGCIRIGNGQNSTVRDCMGSGQVFVTFENPPGTRLAQGMGLVENCKLSGDGTTTCIGIVASGDNPMVHHCTFGGFDKAILLAGHGPVVIGCHFETNQYGIICGMGGDGNANVVSVMLIANCNFEACGTMIDVVASTSGTIISSGGQCHSTPSMGGVPNDTSKYGLRLRDGKYNLLTIDNFAVSGTADNALISIGTSIGRPLNKFKGLSAFSSAGSTLWELPGSATGGFAAVDQAACATFELCSISPIWKYNDLPWDSLSGAQITGVSLIYTSASRGQGPLVGGLITGAGVTAGTTITANGTTFFNATLDDGAGGAGAILNFSSFSGVDPVAGAVITGSVSEIATMVATIDNGSGSAGHNLTIGQATITSATISNGSGGSGTQLTFANANVSGTLAASFLAGIQPIGGLVVAGSGISADTYIIAGAVGATTTTVTLNKAYNFSGTITLTPDLRVGYRLNDDNNSGASHSWVVATRVDATHFTLSGASDQLIVGSFIWIKTVTTAALTTQNSVTSWNVSGGNQNIGFSAAFFVNNTWAVNNSQTVGPVTMTAYRCLTGDEFIITDSGTAAASNFAANVAAGGGANTVKLRMDGKTGFIIV